MRALCRTTGRSRPKLTANLGFRYEIPTPVTEAHGQQSFMNPKLANPGAGGIPGAYEFLGKRHWEDGFQQLSGYLQ
jgi:hypothetical protein